ncbi:MAG: hypothetical protein Q4F44_06960, partial [Bacteroidales bacterium]|nr:hypothetical protein [Bacteroidales bacterium]
YCKDLWESSGLKALLCKAASCASRGAKRRHYQNGKVKTENGKLISFDNAGSNRSSAVPQKWHRLGCEKAALSNVKATYDLQGRKVENPTKGIYIINGKKIFIK